MASNLEDFFDQIMDSRLEVFDEIMVSSLEGFFDQIMFSSLEDLSIKSWFQV